MVLLRALKTIGGGMCVVRKISFTMKQQNCSHTTGALHHPTMIYYCFLTASFALFLGPVDEVSDVAILPLVSCRQLTSRSHSLA